MPWRGEVPLFRPGRLPAWSWLLGPLSASFLRGRPGGRDSQGVRLSRITPPLLSFSLSSVCVAEGLALEEMTANSWVFRGL